MMAKVKNPARNSLRRIIGIATGAVALVAIDLFAYKIFGIAISCPWYQLTGWHCSGCGATRMLLALMRGDFCQALHYNVLLLILLPFGIWLLSDSLYHSVKGGKKLVDQIPEWVWIVLIVVAILFGILRNLSTFSFLAPTDL